MDTNQYLSGAFTLNVTDGAAFVFDLVAQDVQNAVRQPAAQPGGIARIRGRAAGEIA